MRGLLSNGDSGLTDAFINLDQNKKTKLAQHSAKLLL